MPQMSEAIREAFTQLFPREISRLSRQGLLRREGREFVIEDLAVLTATAEADLA